MRKILIPFHIFAQAILFLPFFCTSLFAGICLSDEAATLGRTLATGDHKGYSFVKAAGNIRVTGTLENGSTTTNSSTGILLSADTCLCSRHIFEDPLFIGKPTAATIIFHPDPAAVLALSSGDTPTADVKATLDLSTLELHPTHDLACIKLTHALHTVPILPLIFQRPKAFPMAHLVSYSSQYINGEPIPVSKTMRHVSTLDFQEMEIHRKRNPPEICLGKHCIVSKDERGRTLYRVEMTPPVLFSFTTEGDSGAPLVLPQGIVGINIGAYDYEVDATKHCIMHAVPLYLPEVRDWILARTPKSVIRRHLLRLFGAFMP